MVIQYDGQEIEMSDEFSFSKGNPKDIPNDINVYGTCYSVEEPDTEVFRKDLKGVTFYNCNLDNCFIPEGNTVIGGTHKRFKVQNDGNDWVLDKFNNPIEPVSAKVYQKYNLPVPNPKGLPTKMVEEIIDLQMVVKSLANLK